MLAPRQSTRVTRNLSQRVNIRQGGMARSLGETNSIVWGDARGKFAGIESRSASRPQPEVRL